MLKIISLIPNLGILITLTSLTVWEDEDLEREKGREKSEEGISDDNNFMLRYTWCFDWNIPKSMLLKKINVPWEFRVDCVLRGIVHDAGQPRTRAIHYSIHAENVLIRRFHWPRPTSKTCGLWEKEKLNIRPVSSTDD